MLQFPRHQQGDAMNSLSKLALAFGLTIAVAAHAEDGKPAKGAPAAAAKGAPKKSAPPADARKAGAATRAAGGNPASDKVKKAGMDASGDTGDMKH
jgi:hypothetical protein